jgi:hypothetical protein
MGVRFVDLCIHFRFVQHTKGCFDRGGSGYVIRKAGLASLGVSVIFFVSVLRDRQFIVS